MSNPLTIREHEVWTAGAEAMKREALREIERQIALDTALSPYNHIRTPSVALLCLHAVSNIRLAPPEVES